MCFFIKIMGVVAVPTFKSRSNEWPIPSFNFSSCEMCKHCSNDFFLWTTTWFNMSYLCTLCKCTCVHWWSYDSHTSPLYYHSFVIIINLLPNSRRLSFLFVDRATVNTINFICRRQWIIALFAFDMRSAMADTAGVLSQIKSTVPQ